jgi:hypothetical protein
LGINTEGIGNIFPDLVPERLPEPFDPESLTIKVLMAIAGEIVAAEKILVSKPGVGVHVFGDDVAAGSSD